MNSHELRQQGLYEADKSTKHSAKNNIIRLCTRYFVIPFFMPPTFFHSLPLVTLIARFVKGEKKEEERIRISFSGKFAEMLNEENEVVLN